MISCYTNLLHKRFGDKLDDKGREYMDFVIDGTKRMHGLIRA